MTAKCNLFLDDDELSETSSFIHLLDKHNAEYSEETQILKHSPYYSENQFCALLTNPGLCILDMNIQNVFTKFDELEIFINSVNSDNPISVICLNECWIDKNCDMSLLSLPNYKMIYKIGACPGHPHCGLIIYVHEQFTCNEITVNHLPTGWEYLCTEISLHNEFE